MSLSKQELFDRIRRDSWQRQLSIRALSKKYGVHRRLVRERFPRPSHPAPPGGADVTVGVHVNVALARFS
ncbi:hypothetical protein [Streptomyces sp. Agncl-13]|uniref:hypothetical protein n=1 Tax=Streptomyces sp. Agncl-13 TaxID=3400628 RepID=UPI003A8985DA